MNAPQSQLAQQAFSIPIKICDGLFMVDQHIAQVQKQLNAGCLILLNQFSNTCH